MRYPNLRDARKAAKLTQAQLAKLIGVNRATISKYETGEITPSIKQYIEMGKHLNVSWPELIDDTELAADMVKKHIKGSLSVEKPDDTIEVVPNKEALIAAFDLLNEEGQNKAVERVEELTEIPKYKK